MTKVRSSRRFQIQSRNLEIASDIDDCVVLEAATGNRLRDFLSSVVVDALWTALGTATASAYSAGLFFLGALIVTQLRPCAQTA